MSKRIRKSLMKIKSSDGDGDVFEVDYKFVKKMGDVEINDKVRC